MNQTFKTFQAFSIAEIEASISDFAVSEQINPLSLGLTDMPQGGFLAILGYDDSKFTPVEFVKHTTDFDMLDSDEDVEIFEGHLNADEAEDEEKIGDDIICHAVTNEYGECVVLVMLAAKQ